MQIIEKLKIEREKLSSEFNETRREYKTEIRRIDTALRKFRQGVEALGHNSSGARTNRLTATAEIEKILAEYGQSKVKDICFQLRQRGFPQIVAQTVSGILQRNDKAGKRFIKTAPATYDLLEKTEYVFADKDLKEPFTDKEDVLGGDDELQKIF